MDIKKLRAKCVEKGMTLKELAKGIGISVDTLRRRMCSNTLTVKDVISIKNILSLTIEEVISIFFNITVA